MKTVPCPTCPWRKSSTIGGSDIPGFSISLMRGLACTVGEGDAFRTIMACHGCVPGEEGPCIGYVAVEGWSNLALRVMAMEGKIDMHAIMHDSEGIELWPSFLEMLEAYEAVADGR